MFDLRKISKKTTQWGPVHPIDLFESLSIRSSDVKDLWRPQADALREWHDHRTESDVLFKLNTGAGKTLIGLLAAQSLVNELHGKVLYVCSTNQLVEQTQEKAEEYGLEVSTYYGSTWSGDGYTRCICPCVTNYQSLFTGKSIFRNEDIDAVIFDDAHTAYSIIRDRFTLKIDQSVFPDSYNGITGLCRDYFNSVNRGQTYEDVVSGQEPGSVIFAPTFLTSGLAEDFLGYLVDEGVTEELDTKFAWEYVKDRLSLCAVVIGAGSVQFTPPLVPTHTLRVMGSTTRRLYLSATMPRDDVLYRTFAHMPKTVISPGGRAGDCERMILPAPKGVSEEDAREWVQEGTEGFKVLIMVPSGRESSSWTGYAEVFDTKHGNERLRQFAASSDEKLVLVARYDGIDLPGEACRVLVVDGLPSGMDLLSRFFEQSLDIRGITNGTVASRFVQVVGRISRGLTDYGVVILVGPQLLKWLDDPRNRSLLPTHIQKQLAIGDSLRDTYSSNDDMLLRDVIAKCLEREEDWLDVYKEMMSSTDGDSTPKDADISNNIAMLERRFMKRFWNFEYAEAGKALGELLAITEDYDKGLTAWYKHWLGFCAKLSDDQAEATRLYQHAGNLRMCLGRIPSKPGSQVAGKPLSPQATKMAGIASDGKDKVLVALDKVIAGLSGGSSSNQVEESLKQTGHYLGFTASRPDHDVGTGPDVLWVLSDQKFGAIIEAKTDKTTDYDKGEMGQFHQHIQWVKENYPDVDDRANYIVGPKHGCTASSTPPDDLNVVTLSEMQRVAKDIRDVYDDALAGGDDLFFGSRIEEGIEQKSLKWETLFENLDAANILTL